MNDTTKHTKGQYCNASVFDRTGWARSHRCSNKATRDGFCGIHHPDAQAKRDQKSREKFERDTANSIYAKYATLTAERDSLLRDKKELVGALDGLLVEVESLDDYSLTRDTETYKAQACWDYAMEQAVNVLAKHRSRA